jgi:hypothetical protein
MRLLCWGFDKAAITNGRKLSEALILRSNAQRCVSKDEGVTPQPTNRVMPALVAGPRGYTAALLQKKHLFHRSADHGVDGRHKAGHDG